MFYHSLVSDWNHGNAHFLRGVASELMARGHDVVVWEPADGWSRRNLIDDHGEATIDEFHRAYPQLRSRSYQLDALNLDACLDGADLVIVHEWSPHSLVEAVGRHRARNSGHRLFFHDTHHRSVTDPAGIAAYRLEHYDGVLAYGEAIREIYQKNGWGRQVWTWHEAADTRVFRPLLSERINGDVVWIGNWGDNERTAELDEFLLGPIKKLGLKARVHGVRYSQEALDALTDAGIEYGGWIANYRVPEAFSRYRVTVHVPRRPYASVLPGIPTIRPFEALACGIPLVSAPWDDIEGLFRPGCDYLIASTGREMARKLEMLLKDRWMASEIATNGRQRILERHTCTHRVDELLGIYAGVASAAQKTTMMTGLA
jgi:spore maturation protein CgeB